MIEWLANNIGTIIIALALVCIVFAILIKMVRDQKKGKSPCGCNCANCSMSCSYHKSK